MASASLQLAPFTSKGHTAQSFQGSLSPALAAMHIWASEHLWHCGVHWIADLGPTRITHQGVSHWTVKGILLGSIPGTSQVLFHSILLYPINIIMIIITQSWKRLPGSVLSALYTLICFILTEIWEVNLIFVPILQIKNQKLRKVKWLAQSHTELWFRIKYDLLQGPSSFHLDKEVQELGPGPPFSCRAAGC